MAGTDCLSRKKSWVDYQGKSFRVMRNGVGIVSEIPSRYAQSIFNKVFEFGVGVALLERTPLGNYAIVISNAHTIGRSRA
jgi:hypothetical protein